MWFEDASAALAELPRRLQTRCETMSTQWQPPIWHILRTSSVLPGVEFTEIP